MIGNMSTIPTIPNAGPASMLLKLGAVLGIGLYVAGHSLYNVEGGHRAIVFNRLVGVKDKVISCCLILRVYNLH